MGYIIDFVMISALSSVLFVLLGLVLLTFNDQDGRYTIRHKGNPVMLRLGTREIELTRAITLLLGVVLSGIGAYDLAVMLF